MLGMKKKTTEEAVPEDTEVPQDLTEEVPQAVPEEEVEEATPIEEPEESQSNPEEPSELDLWASDVIKRLESLEAAFYRLKNSL